MKRIFISYAREDRSTIENIAHRLIRDGYEVWWDHHIRAGEPYRERIESQLDCADKVIVIWSPHSVRSLFVLDEAEHAKAADKLVPITMKGAKPPIGFGGFHTLDASEVEANFEMLRAALEHTKPPLPRRESWSPSQRIRLGSVVLIAFAAFVGAGIFLSGLYPIVSGCDLRGLESRLDYRCYRSNALRVAFVYPQDALTLDTTKEDQLLLPMLSSSRRVEVLIRKEGKKGHDDIRKAREHEYRALTDQRFFINHIKPMVEEPWANFYVLTGHKPNGDEFYYKRWYVDGGIVSIEFDYSSDKISLYNKIIPDMVKERFIIF